MSTAEISPVTDPATLRLTPPVPMSRLAHLTPREHEILGLMASGLSNDAIRQQLWITRKTTESHVARIYAKLDLPPSPDVHRRVTAALAFHAAA